MAFLQRTFNLSSSLEDQVAENLKKVTLSPRKGSAISQLSPLRKKESKSSGVASIKAWSPSSKIDVRKPGIVDGPRNYTSGRNLPQTPGKDLKLSTSGASSHSITRKGSQRSAVNGNPSTFGAVTPSPSSSRNSSISTCTAGASTVGTVAHLTASRASSLSSVGEGKASRIRSSTRTVVTLSSSIVSTSDIGQSDVVKRLFGSAKLPRAPTAPARVVQKSNSKPVSNNSNDSNGSNNAKGSSSSIRSDSKSTSAVKADRPISVPLKRPTALILNQGLSSSGDLSCQSISVQRSQSQCTPTGKRAVSTTVPQSPSKGVTGLTVKKAEIGKLFGLVGFTKVDVATSQVIPFAAISSLISPRSTDTGSVQLDRTMKDAMQRSVAAKATLLAAEAAAESARLEAMVAHAEALAAARAVVWEEEAGRSVLGSSHRSGLSNLAASTVPPTSASTTATTPDTPLSPSDKIEPLTKKDCWMKAVSSSDDLSPKREAENPFKGML